MELLGPTFERLGPCIAAGAVGWMLRQSFFTETDAEVGLVVWVYLQQEELILALVFVTILC
jgi:hypothetical protein